MPVQPRPHREVLDQSVFHLLRVALQEHTALWNERVGAGPAVECTKPQYAVLRAVEADPGLDQASAAQFAGSDKATVAALLERLEDRRLIRREVDPLDRRRRKLYLTKQGESLLASVGPVVAGVNQEILSRLSPSEQADLVILLRKLARR
jgi:MarR family transcriptional regulator, temperature-dependent positive regulator of motility